jgi:hypothetical protein
VDMMRRLTRTQETIKRWHEEGANGVVSVIVSFHIHHGSRED